MFLGVLLLSAGCRSEPETAQDTVRDVVERGPLKLVVEARPAEVLLGDPVGVTLHLHTPEDYEIRWPTPADFAGLEVRQLAAPARLPSSYGGWDWQCRFRVESLVSGTLEIPPLTVMYRRRTDQPTATPAYNNELTSSALRVVVRSALTAQDSVTNPRDITGPLMPPKSAWEALRPWLVVVGGLAVLVGGIVALWRLRQRRRAQSPSVPPEIWALRMLGRLQPEEVEEGRAREFYYELSEIVRSYVEKKFGLAAPEMTTEEFLAALARDRSALPYDTARLRAFLESCDIVKYAAYRPARQDAEHALATARAFVHATAAAAEQACQPGQATSGGQAA